MPDRFLLERIYRRSEFSSNADERLHVTGTLIGAAMDGARPADPAYDRLVGQLDAIEIKPLPKTTT